MTVWSEHELPPQFTAIHVLDDSSIVLGMDILPKLGEVINTPHEQAILSILQEMKKKKKEA